MQVLWFVVLGALTVVPLFKLLPRFGLNPWWSLAALFLPGLIVLLWIMASRVDDT